MGSSPTSPIDSSLCLIRPHHDLHAGKRLCLPRAGKWERPSTMNDDVHSYKLNRTVAWVSLTLGATSGLVLGLWSFGGPVEVPVWLGEYGGVSRRLARLSHISLFGLGILNLLVARELPRCALRARSQKAASIAMNFGNVFLPCTLLAAAIHHPLKYAMGLPGLSVALALAVTAYGVGRNR